MPYSTGPRAPESRTIVACIMGKFPSNGGTPAPRSLRWNPVVTVNLANLFQKKGRGLTTQRQRDCREWLAWELLQLEHCGWAGPCYLFTRPGEVSCSPPCWTETFIVSIGYRMGSRTSPLLYYREVIASLVRAQSARTRPGGSICRMLRVPDRQSS